METKTLGPVQKISKKSSVLVDFLVWQIFFFKFRLVLYILTIPVQSAVFAYCNLQSDKSGWCCEMVMLMMMMLWDDDGDDDDDDDDDEII